MVHDETGRAASHEFRVNGVAIGFPDDVFTARDALTRSGNVPASEFQLVMVHAGRTRLYLTDDDIDAHANAGGELRAFPGDRSFGFAVDEVGQIWGAEEMEVDEFLRHWPPAEGQHWALERDDEPDTVLAAGGVLAFGPDGVEHVVSKKNGHPGTIMVMVVTTAGIFPAEGSKRYPINLAIAVVLADAARKLGITAPSDWIVQVAGADVNAALSFAQAGLSGSVTIEWGAREGGGGA